MRFEVPITQVKIARLLDVNHSLIIYIPSTRNIMNKKHIWKMLKYQDIKIKKYHNQDFDLET